MIDTGSGYPWSQSKIGSYFGDNKDLNMNKIDYRDNKDNIETMTNYRDIKNNFDIKTNYGNDKQNIF